MTRFAHRLLFACALGALAVPASAQNAPATPAASSEAPVTPVRYTAAQFFETTSYSIGGGGHAFSPDGTRLLISSNKSGTFNVYAMPVAGGEPVALTDSASDGRFAISYFPRDERILFEGDSGGNELDHIYVRAADGTVRDLTPGTGSRHNLPGGAVMAPPSSSAPTNAILPPLTSMPMTPPAMNGG
jgi:hypothetical protein